MDMERLIDYALRFVGTRYNWGGNDPLLGFDCSGYVQELMMAAGILPRSNNKINAQQIYNAIELNSGHNVWGAGSIAFFGKDFKSISHIGFCIDNYLMLHAASGDHTTTTEDVAAAQNAFVRMDQIRYRKDFLCVLKPKYAGHI